MFAFQEMLDKFGNQIYFYIIGTLLYLFQTIKLANKLNGTMTKIQRNTMPMHLNSIPAIAISFAHSATASS